MKHDGKKYLVIHGEKMIAELSKDFQVQIQDYDGLKVGLIAIEDPNKVPEKLQSLIDDGLEIR